MSNIFTELRKDFKKRSFKRYHCDRYKKVQEHWKKPKGLDSRVRRKFKGSAMMPGKKFRLPPVLRDIMPNGLREIVIKNVDELRSLQYLSEKYCATIAGATGSRKRIEIVNEAKKLGITLTNGEARLAVALPE